jgi:hypothetical protein
MNERSVKMRLLTLALIFVVPFFTAFVVQTLWNWFVAGALNASPLSYWHAFGLGLFIYLLRAWHDNAVDETKNLKITLVLLRACVPPEKERLRSPKMNGQMHSSSSL